MFQRILLPVDNSRYSDLCLELAMSLAKAFGSTIVGFHAYAAQLHQGRFNQLETSLPQKYQQPGGLEQQRQLHASLILQGLELISRSYLEGCAERCRERGVAFETTVAEGKNYAEVVREATKGYDLVMMGAKGLGEEEGQLLGSVCLRAVRQLMGVDTLIIKDNASLGGPIMATLDGSFCSCRGFQLALSLAKAFGAEVEAMAAYDPEFHSRVFRNLVGVLSDEAGKLFRFQEQERLHQEVIDQGMAKLCQAHLDWAQGMAKQAGVPFQGRVLQGKAATAITNYVSQCRPSLLVAGRFGAHQVDGMDLGSTVEALLLYSPANLLIAANGKALPLKDAPSIKEAALILWGQDAETRLQNVPVFARAMVRRAIEDYARRHGYIEVTPEVMTEARDKMGM